MSTKEDASAYAAAMTEDSIAMFREFFAPALETWHWMCRPRDVPAAALPFVEQWRKDGLVKWFSGKNRSYVLTKKGRAVGRIIFGLDNTDGQERAEKGE